MRGLGYTRTVSVGLVICMLAATVGGLITMPTARGQSYPNPVAHVDGNETMQNLGRSVALVDLNGDGIADLVAGAPYTTANGLTKSGSVTIYLSSGGVAMARTIVVNGTGAEELFGWTVANVGDVNGDGLDDLAVGTPFADPAGATDAGNITIFYSWPGFDGRPNATINSANAGEELGYSLAAGGDINGDGFADMLAGAPGFGSGAGRAYVYYGGNPPSAMPAKTFTGTQAGAELGFSVSGGASVDGNSLLDMVAGAPGQGASGAAYIVRDLSRANPSVTVVNGPSTDENFSFSVCMVPDLNNDTIADIAIGAPTNSVHGSHAGAVYVLYGGSKFNTVPDLTLYGSPGEWFGWSLAAGDFHEDGISDLIVGAPNSRLNTTSVGRAYAFYGATAPSVTPSMVMVPDSGSSLFGACMAVGGNLTGDKAPDFAVADPLFNVPGAPNAGRVYVYAGQYVVYPSNPIVKGYVYVPNTTQGIQGFTITIESATFKKSTITNAAGYFEMTAIPGTFWLNASKAGYTTNSTTVTLAMNDNVTVPPFYPLKVPTVSGTVADNMTGLMVQGATVALYNGSDRVLEMTTGSNGSYWFSLPDSYVPPVGGSIDLSVKVWDAAYYGSMADITLARNQSVSLNFDLDSFMVIGGTVREALFLSVVRGATVQANQGQTIVATTTTDIRGGYQLTATNATPGMPIYVNVTAAGYFRTMQNLIVLPNATSTLNFILQPDNTPPVSQIDALPQYTTTAVFSLNATASDANGIQEVELWYRHGESGSYALHSTATAAPYGFNFDSTATGGDGTYSFYSIAVDIAGNVEAPPAGNDTWTILDSTPPALSVTSPAEGQFVTSSTVQATWEGSDSGTGIQKFEVSLDSASWTDEGYGLSCVFADVADGPHTLDVRATDNVSLQTIVHVDFTVDTVYPTSRVDSLPPYQAYEGFMVNVTASDADGVQEVQLWYRHGGSGAFEYFGADPEAPYSFEFNSSSVAGDGLYEFYSRAVDIAGNNESAPATNDTWTIVDTVPPAVYITAPLMNQTVGSTTVQVNWSGSDAASGIGDYQVRIDGGQWVDNGLTAQTSFASVTDGNHTVDVMASDRAGHSSLANVSFMVDSIAPTVSIISPTDGEAISQKAITIRWTASDVGSGIMLLEVSKDGLNWVPVDVDSTDYVFSTVGTIPEGHYTVSVRATDFGGLTATDSARVVVDRTPPSVSIISPSEGQVIKKSSVTIQWTMTDMGSGVAYVQVSVDHGTFNSVSTNESWPLTDLSNGGHNVTVRVTDNAGNHKDVNVSFTVSAEAGISALLVGGVAIVAVAAVLAAVLLLRRRRPPVHVPPKNQGKT